MPYNNIPLRPLNRRFRMDAKDMDCLVWYVISGCKKEEAYGLFVRPDIKATSPSQLKIYSSQFFSSKDARDFISAYRDTLDGANKPKGETTADDREKRKATAVQSFTDKVVEKMHENLETVEEMDAVAKLADRVGVLGDGEEVVEQPRRYLPETCSACRYKLFVEENIKKGNIEDN